MTPSYPWSITFLTEYIFTYFIGFYVCITLKIAHTVDNQNFQTASYKDPRLKHENVKLRTS